MRLCVLSLVLLCSNAFATTGNNDMTDHQPNAEALFAGGCFWCMQPAFDKLEGVVKTTVGYSGGHTENPSYEQVSSGTTGHAEALHVIYDPEKISYDELLDVFWRNIDPLAKPEDGQFCDKGTQYRAEIFYYNDQQKQLAEQSKQQQETHFQQPLQTLIEPATPFYPAEKYHQDYYKKNPIRYKTYRYLCGRDKRLKTLWQ